MTEHEVDARIGRLISRYAEVRRKIACLKDKLQESREPAYQLSIALNPGPQLRSERILKALATLDMGEVVALTSDLKASEEEKAGIENSLREIGLEDLIKP